MFPLPTSPLKGEEPRKLPPKGRESKVSGYAAAGEGKGEGFLTMQFEEDE